MVAESQAPRPAGWTSADAAGLPILPGLLRWDEVKAGRVDHAIRFTTDVTSTTTSGRRGTRQARCRRVVPADGRPVPPQGVVLHDRLSAQAKVVIKAMKQYGLVLADNGSSWYFQGTSEGWPEALLDQLKRIPASAFEAVDTSSMKVSANSAKVKG